MSKRLPSNLTAALGVLTQTQAALFALVNAAHDREKADADWDALLITIANTPQTGPDPATVNPDLLSLAFSLTAARDAARRALLEAAVAAVDMLPGPDPKTGNFPWETPEQAFERGVSEGMAAHAKTVR